MGSSKEGGVLFKEMDDSEVVTVRQRGKDRFEKEKKFKGKNQPVDDGK